MGVVSDFSNASYRGFSNGSKFSKLSLLVIAILLFDVIYLNYKVFFTYERPLVQTVSEKSNENSESTNAEATSCADCEERITKLEKSLTGKVSTTTTTASSAREYYVPFGTGYSTAEEWTDVSGLSAYVDSTQYGSIKSAVFEASLNTPTGNQTAYARLYNVTDKHPVWNSEVSISGGTPKLLTATIKLDEGNKLYQVQMKTQLKFQTNLDQSRLHITTN